MEDEMRLPSKIPKLEKIERKKREPHVPLAMFYDLDKFQYEIGIDEAGEDPCLDVYMLLQLCYLKTDPWIQALFVTVKKSRKIN